MQGLASELVRPMSRLRAVILQPSAVEQTAPATGLAEVSVFLYEQGRLRGPVGFSTVGMRIQNEHSGSSSLFAQPMAIEPIPESPGPESLTPPGEAEEASTGKMPKTARGVLEARMDVVLAALRADFEAPSATLRQGHLALLKRWYYRPEVRREGEIFFADADEHWPIKAMLRGVGRVAAKTLAQASRA